MDVAAYGVGNIVSVAVDPRTGEQYITSWYDNVIHKISLDGVKSVFAGSGAHGISDGIGTSSSFGIFLSQISYCPYDDNFYVVDVYNNIIRQVSKTADVRTIIGGQGSTISGSTDGLGTNALLSIPLGVACNLLTGDIIITDGGHVLRFVSYSSRDVALFAGALGQQGFANGQGTYARFKHITIIAENPVNTHFYTTDDGNNVIRQVTLQGFVSTFAGYPGVAGSRDGMGTFAYFTEPWGLACDELSGNIIVSDHSTHKVLSIDVSTALVSTIGGSIDLGYANGMGTFAKVKANNFYRLFHLMF